MKNELTTEITKKTVCCRKSLDPNTEYSILSPLILFSDWEMPGKMFQL